MPQSIYAEHTFCVRTDSLLERISSYLNNVQMWNRRWDDNPMPQFQFKALLLIAEIYEYARQYIQNYEESLSDYFGGWTLKKSLDYVAIVEDLQQNLNEIKDDFELCDINYNNLVNVLGVGCIPLCGPILRELYEHGLDGFWEDNGKKGRATISSSLLWNATSKSDSKYRFGRLFKNAHEQLDEKCSFTKSDDPNDLVYTGEQRKKGISYRIAFKAKPFENFKIKIEQEDFDCLQYLLDIQRKAEDASAKDICRELGKALEILRNVFMSAAEDIYYIRTGDFTEIERVYDKDALKKYYTELPFEKYNAAKEEFVENFVDEIDIKFANWRINKDYVGRIISEEEYEEFFCEWRDKVMEAMKSYSELWKLRVHSGGLDVGVTPENFARMFYRREGVDKYFIELQWELEELEKRREKRLLINQEQKLSPKQEAVSDFVEKIILLATSTYKEWNGKYVVPAAHKPEVRIVIDKVRLIQYIQDKKNNCFEELVELCYPEMSAQQFCKYVIKLREDGFFGSLPKNLLAKAIAPILELGEGAIKNYLSKS